MDKYFICFVLFSVLFFQGCRKNKGPSEKNVVGSSVKFDYADNIDIRKDGFCYVATLKNPWDTSKILHKYNLIPRDSIIPGDLPSGTVIRIPVKKAAVYSSVHCSLLKMLGCIDAICGVCDLKYINIPYIQKACKEGKITDLGESSNPDIERIISSNPDIVMLSPFENSGGYGLYGKINIPVVECSDYMETSALGRSEWMRFYGLLFGCENSADSLFNVVRENYDSLCNIVRDINPKPTLITELKSSSVWYIAGGRSTSGRLYADAGFKYVFSEDKRSGAYPQSFEYVIENGAEADIWLFKYNSTDDITYSSMRDEYYPYTKFKAYKDRNVYACNTGKTTFYEDVSFRPDLLLKDLIFIAHPVLRNGPLRYFKKLKEK